MHRGILVPSLAASLLVGGCLKDVIAPDQFQVISLVTASKLDSTHCDVKWKSETNDPHRPYLFVTTISAGDSTTGQAFDSTIATDSATVELVLAGAGNAGVGWNFSWSGFSTSGDTTVTHCVVQ